VYWRRQGTNATRHAFLDRHLLEPPELSKHFLCRHVWTAEIFETLATQITRAAEKNKPDGLLIRCSNATRGPCHRDHPDMATEHRGPASLKTILTVFYGYYISGLRERERKDMNKRIFPITMPKWGIEMQQGTVTGWHVAVGAATRKGDHLLDVETEKIVNSVEAPVSGTLRLIRADAGVTENVGALIGVIADTSVSEAELEDFVRGFTPADASFEPAGGMSLSPKQRAAIPVTPSPAEVSDGDTRISPIARRIAERLGADISKITGTGRAGRISKEDVEAYAAAHSAGAARSGAAAPAGSDVASASPSAPPDRLKLSSMRAAIGRRLLESSQSIPHYRVSVDVECGALLARAQSSGTSDAKVSFNDLVVRATALALRQHPSLNSHLVGDEILTFSTADICVAVATENGLVAPVIRSADTKTPAQIGAEIKALAEHARAGSLTREQISGGTFTISNLGMFGIDRFDAIINPPQVGILAVAAVSDRLIVRHGAPAVEKVATLTLSADHRVIDGAVAARFLGSLKSLLQSPEAL
jgi:pyruvate dehydrogenase E2 component (dihydrolipoamide acetyltransferase)